MGEGLRDTRLIVQPTSAPRAWPGLDPFRGRLFALIELVLLLALLAVPLRVISFGCLPPDDALRHAAKAVSGKPWPEIRVMRSDITLEHNPGWHWLLQTLHRGTGWDPTATGALLGGVDVPVVRRLTPILVSTS
jgi:hypothetical protein